VVADLRGDLLGASTDLNAADLRWLSPLALWTSILAGPTALAADQLTSYALVKWTCTTQRQDVLYLIPFVALAIAAGGACVAWQALRRTQENLPTDGGDPQQRARFMAILGLTVTAFFALSIVALAIPPAVLDACH
jgi:hypothetical protein